MREAGDPITRICLNAACPHCGHSGNARLVDADLQDECGLRITLDCEGDAAISNAFDDGERGARLGVSCVDCGMDYDLIIGAKADWEQRYSP